MLKFGTGKITVPDDQDQAPIQRTASAYTEDEWAAVMDEGEQTEGE